MDESLNTPLETFDIWKEKKLIQEFNQRRQELLDQSIKEKLSQHITNGRKELNELAVRNWLKKKDQAKKEQERKCAPEKGTVSKVIHRSRSNSIYSRPMPISDLSMSFRSNLAPSAYRGDNNLETMAVKNDNIKIKKDKGAGDCSRCDFAKVYKNKLEPQESNEEERTRTETISSLDFSNNNKWNSKTLEEYYRLLYGYYNDSLQDGNYEYSHSGSSISDREANNKISYNQWLRRKNRLLKERKLHEERAKLLSEDQKMQKRLMSKQALENWYVKKACQTFKSQLNFLKAPTFRRLENSQRQCV
ncbi:uncharacterized protein isoform X2 [Rhodnius prolixus]|uniref:uncharacterized protein isoform X2 n=1 Tax=Rhodnius prolixus TaxID=13249 RepID=UPI003D18A128